MPRTRTRQAQAQDQEGRFVEVDASVTFHAGVMHVSGAPQHPTRVAVFESSNGLTQYTAVEWTDAATGARRTSCNCPGWTVKKRGKPRSCMHTLDLEGGKSCPRRRVDTQAIHTSAQAEELIPKVDGRYLRSIMLE